VDDPTFDIDHKSANHLARKSHLAIVVFRAIGVFDGILPCHNRPELALFRVLSCQQNAMVQTAIQIFTCLKHMFSSMPFLLTL